MEGYCSDGGWRPSHVYVSSRSAEKSAALQAKYPTVISIESDNQRIIDQCEIIFVGLLPDVAREILPRLKIGRQHFLISMMATISLRAAPEYIAKTRPDFGLSGTLHIDEDA